MLVRATLPSREKPAHAKSFSISHGGEPAALRLWGRGRLLRGVRRLHAPRRSGMRANGVDHVGRGPPVEHGARVPANGNSSTRVPQARCCARPGVGIPREREAPGACTAEKSVKRAYASTRYSWGAAPRAPARAVGSGGLRLLRTGAACPGAEPVAVGGRDGAASFPAAATPPDRAAAGGLAVSCRRGRGSDRRRPVGRRPR